MSALKLIYQSQSIDESKHEPLCCCEKNEWEIAGQGEVMTSSRGTVFQQDTTVGGGPSRYFSFFF